MYLKEFKNLSFLNNDWNAYQFFFSENYLIFNISRKMLAYTCWKVPRDSRMSWNGIKQREITRIGKFNNGLSLQYMTTPCL